jgi:hypothetical protein
MNQQTAEKIATYRKAADAYGVPNEELEVYTGCSWRRVGIKDKNETVMYPCNASDRHPDICGGAVLEALVAAFNAMPGALEEIARLRVELRAARGPNAG